MSKNLSIKKKAIYNTLINQLSDEVLLCLIFPCMKEKKLPKLDSRVFHHIILNKLKYPHKISMDSCLLDYRVTYTKTCGNCHLCNRQSLLHGIFCVTYLRYHEHIALCINCSSKLERRKDRVLESTGTTEFYALLRKIALINRFLPKDVSDIIVYNLNCLYGFNL